MTYDNFVYRYDKFITPHFRNVEVRAIDYFALEGFLNTLSNKNSVHRRSTRTWA